MAHEPHNKGKTLQWKGNVVHKASFKKKSTIMWHKVACWVYFLTSIFWLLMFIIIQRALQDWGANGFVLKGALQNNIPTKDRLAAWQHINSGTFECKTNRFITKILSRTVQNCKVPQKATIVYKTSFKTKIHPELN